MTNSCRDDNELAKSMRRLFNSDNYLKKLIKEPLQETFKLLCDEHGLIDDFIEVTVLLIFVHFDLFGRPCAGEAYNKPRNTGKNAVLFMTEYLGRVDGRYKEVGGLLYHSLRHGYVHVFTPKRIQLKNGEMLDFSFVSFHKTLKHLSLTQREETEMHGNIKIHRLLVNVTKLYEDFIIAIDKYTDDIVRDQEISNRFQNSFTSRRIENTEEGLRKKNSNLGSGFEYIYRQMPE